MHYANYQEYMKAQQEAVNNLPLFFAFSNKQFKEQMEKRGLKETDTDKIYRVSNGGFILRSDLPKLREFESRPDPLPELMADPEWAEDAFYYEMCNHEYGINWQGDWDVCNCFSDQDLPYSEEYTYKDYLVMCPCWREGLNKSYARAVRRYFRDAEENEWF